MQFIKDLVKYFVKFPILANIIIALTIIAGVASMVMTKKSFFPKRSDKNIIIQVAYPGASPEEMEEGVTRKIEESIKSVAGVDELVSTSSENSASITVITLDNYNIDDVYTEIKNAVDGINSFPESAEKPIIYKQRQRSTAQWLGLTGDVDLKTLEMYGDKIKDDLLASGVISQVNVTGLTSKEISVELSEQNMRRYNIDFDDIVNVLKNNRDFSAGSIKAENEEILIRSKDKKTEAEFIGEIVIRTENDGSNLMISDVATVKEQYADRPDKAYLSGKRAVFIEVRRLEEEDLQKISEFVNTYVDEFNDTYSGVKLDMTWDFMSMLQQRLNLLTSNGLIGLALVLVALGTFLSLRLSFWVAWGIPSSFLGMFILGSFVGLTINMISLFGMILVIGILVDDGIVIAENIYSHFEKHKNPLKAAVEGTIEVLPAVFTSVTTTIIAFLPLLFLTGGFEFLKDMAYVVIFSLGFSLIEAFFVLPSHLASTSVLKIKKEDTRSYKIRKKINSIIDFMKENVYGTMLRYTMKYRAISICFLIALFPITMGLFGGGFINATFFPQIPFNSFNINIAFKPGDRETKVEEYLEKFEKAIWQVNDEFKKELDINDDIINNTFGSLGNTSDGESGSHAGNINVFYKELDDYGINSYDIIDKLYETIGRVPEAEKFSIGGRNRFGKPVSVRLLADDNESLMGATKYLKQELKKLTELKDVQDNVSLGNREMLFDVNSQALFLGFNNAEIIRQVRQGFFGQEVQKLQKGDDEVRVWVRYPKTGRLNVGQLEEMKIKTKDGKAYPLKQLASYKIERGLSGIKHYNANRSINVEADMVDPFGEVPPIMKKVNTEIIPKLKAKFPLVNIDYGGQARESGRAMAEIGLFFGGAFMLIFFVIMITFRSFYQALMIILMIPLGWLGASFGHGLEGHPVSILSAWGMIALSGVIINDAVVFLAKFNSLVKDDGLSVEQAAFEAGQSRFRAIMLTSITTVAGLYPLIKETSFQAQFLIPMAISVAYGVLLGTFIILLFFPVIILFFNDVRLYAKWLWTGTKPTREDVERVVIDNERLNQWAEMK